MTESTRNTVLGLPSDQVGQFISQYLATSDDVARACEAFKVLLPPAVEDKPVRSVATILTLMEECLYLNDGSYEILQRELEDHPDWDGE